MVLFICVPLGLLPYLASLFAWMGVKLFCYWRVVDAWLAGVRPKVLLALAFPAVLLNLAHGQNAFLTTALFGGGALLLRRSPFLADACLGALVYEPATGHPAPSRAAGRPSMTGDRRRSDDGREPHSQRNAGLRNGAVGRLLRDAAADALRSRE